MKQPCEKIGNHVIYLNQVYYIAYAGGQRELAKKDQKEYDKAMAMPWGIQRKELEKLGFDKNPNVIPITGRNLMAFIRELKFVPIFDVYFNQSHLMQITDAIIYESIIQQSYKIALQK